MTGYHGRMAGRHASPKSSERTLALTILVVGTVVSLASLVGGVWVVRAGVVVALIMAYAAVWAAWRELAAEKVRHNEELRHEMGMRAQQAQRFHEESVAMIGRFNARSENLQAVIAKLRRQLGAAKAELSSMRGNNAWLRAEVAERQARVEALETRIAELEAEDTGNIVALPRHVRPSIDDVWGEDEHPTMVDLAKLNLDGLPVHYAKEA
ncbi:hypothetical protein SAMN05428934_10868 [Tessaracoccus flavus]|nr:hypothetical protein SAMN05428934_10868 [Tessaracoccus flavus]